MKRIIQNAAKSWMHLDQAWMCTLVSTVGTYACKFICILMMVLFSFSEDTNAGNHPDSEDLGLTCKRIVGMMDKADYVNALPELNTLIAKSRQQRDFIMEAKGRAMRGQIYMAVGKHDEGYRELTSALDACVELDDGKNIVNDIKTMAYNGLAIYFFSLKGDPYLGKEYFLKAMDIAAKANDERLARIFESNLVQAAIIERDTTFLKFSQELYDWAVDNDNPYVRYIASCQLAQMHSFSGRHSLAEKLLADAERTGDAALIGEKVPYFLSKADVLESKGDFAGTARVLDAALEAVGIGNEAVYFQSVIGSRKTGMYLKAGEYSKALDCGKESLENALRLRQMTHYGKLLLQISQAYEGLGRDSEALAFARRYEHYKDSVYDRDRDMMIRNISAMYNVDKKEKEADYARQMLRKERERNIWLIVSVLFFVVAAAVSLIAFIYKTRMLRKLVSLNQQMALKEKDLLNQLERLKAVEVPDEALVPIQPSETLSAEDNSEAEPESEADTDIAVSETIDRIWTDLLLLMDKTSDWSDEDTSRDAIATKLNTNRTYLSKAVKHHSGQTFSQFVNSHRIRKAIEVLSDPSRRDYPLKALSQELGFKSINAFYTHFKAATGLSPGSFHKNT